MLRRISAALLTCLPGGALAQAQQPTVLNNGPVWKVEFGTTRSSLQLYSGMPLGWMCRMSATDRSVQPQRFFAIHYVQGMQFFLFQTKRSSWTIPADTRMRITLRVNGRSPSTYDAVGAAQGMMWGLSKDAMIDFLATMRSGNRVTIGFLGGNEPAMSIALTSAVPAVESFTACVTQVLELAPAR